jgi:4,5:9,10-diseco-3-hydroxy-5,9,17-trioxoandrosta-1(10),2-diene-4-oate hydrolase
MAEPAAQAATIAVQDRPCYYRHAGPPDAPPLVLLHGGLGNAALHWGRNLADLGRDFHVLAPDLPGFGRTAPLPRPSYPAYAAWVAAFCDAAGVAAGVNVVGNSMGAAIARVFAACYPDRVARLVLVDGGRPVAVGPPLRQILAIGPLGDLLAAVLGRLAGLDAVMSRYVANPALLTPRVRAGIRRGIRAYVRVQRRILLEPSVPPDALAVQCPTLVIWGAQDGLGSPALGEALAAQTGAGPVAVIDHAGHMPMFEQPAAFGRVLREFLAASA